MAKTFNMEINIAKAIGILSIVAGHTKWDILGDFYRSYCWHVPLFFFISGYFFKEELLECSEIIKRYSEFVKKIISKYLGKFYAYHFFYGGITYLVYIWLDRLYGKLPTWKTLTLSAIDTTPFHFNVPNWFLYQLAISVLLFTLIMIICKKINKSDFFPVFVFLPLGVFGILLAKTNFQPSFGLERVIIRTCIALYYIYGGYLYRQVMEKRVNFNLKILGIVTCIYLCVQLYTNGKMNFGLGGGRVHNNISPLITPFLCIYFVLFISKLLAPLVQEKSLIDKIGRNTLHIMANHAFVIFLIELLIFIIEDVNFDKLPKEFLHHFYNMGKYKFLYTFASVLICTYIGELLKFSGRQLKTNLQNGKLCVLPLKNFPSNRMTL